MKKKQFRLAAIAILVVVFLGAALAHLNIEPASGGSSSLPDTSASVSTVPSEPQTEQPDTSPSLTEPASSESAISSAAPAAPEELPPETPAEPKKNAKPSAPVQPSAPPTAEPVPVVHTCTLEIRCDTVTDTSKLENEAVIPYIPADGTILAATEVEYTPGESVFDVLKRTTRAKDIQMEFREDALYSGAYIEGIQYLYEFDGGSLSGWMYRVNGQFPNYGCSQYTVQDGDAIVWMYTCDLGRDVGDNSTW
ncbi:MAG: DUF4430 domain-containing protein [Butyricicoccus sp.]